MKYYRTFTFAVFYAVSSRNVNKHITQSGKIISVKDVIRQVENAGRMC